MKILFLGDIVGREARKTVLSGLPKLKNRYEADIIKFQVYKPETITLKSTFKDFRVESKSSWKEYKFLYDLYERKQSKLCRKHSNLQQFQYFVLLLL